MRSPQRPTGETVVVDFVSGQVLSLLVFVLIVWSALRMGGRR